jgi:hypothetical protein
VALVRTRVGLVPSAVFCSVTDGCGNGFLQSSWLPPNALSPRKRAVGTVGELRSHRRAGSGDLRRTYARSSERVSDPAETPNRRSTRQKSRPRRSPHLESCGRAVQETLWLAVKAETGRSQYSVVSTTEPRSIVATHPERLAEQLGIRAIELDTIDDAACVFYEKFGFVALLDNPQHLFSPMSVVRKLVIAH